MRWISVKKKWPELLQYCYFYDPFKDKQEKGMFLGDGFHNENGDLFKATHWFPVLKKPSKEEIEETVNWLHAEANEQNLKGSNSIK